MVFHYSFNLHFYDAWWCWIIFMCLLLIHTHIYSLIQYLFKSSVHFLSCFLIVEFWVFFTYSGYRSFVEYVICKYFSPACSLSLHCLKVVICRANAFHFDEVQFIFFSIVVLSCLKTSCLILGPPNFFLCFLVIKSLIVLHIYVYDPF